MGHSKCSATRPLRAPHLSLIAAPLRHLILTADDFGRSHAVNEAIERHYQAGFLTQASLMVHAPAADEALRIARRCPRLCVGLHLALCDARASCPSVLTDSAGNFPRSPTHAGFRYFFGKKLADPLRIEIRGQFDAFRALALPATYWDGHAHLHLHPSVLHLTLPIAIEHGFRATRLVREPRSLAPLPLIFQLLSRFARRYLAHHGIRFADQVFGLSKTGQMRTETFARLLGHLPAGTSEIYFHPGAEPAELDLPRLAALVHRGQIALASFAPQA